MALLLSCQQPAFSTYHAKPNLVYLMRQLRLRTFTAKQLLRDNGAMSRTQDLELNRAWGRRDTPSISASWTMMTDDKDMNAGE